MIFLLPIRTSIRPWRRPMANYVFIVANVVFFLMTVSFSHHVNQVTGQSEVLRFWANHFMLTPERPELWQFVTYAFLHGGWGHLIGNMFFLYLFGNNVNDKLGNLGYVCFYLAGAIFSGLGHSILSMNPVLGASGAVAAVTGAYLVLFPQTLITVFYWLFIFIDTIEIPALYFIGFKLIFWDNVLERKMANVAYNAHLSGYAFGVGAILLLLSLGFLSGSQFDLWSMIRQWNRRRIYRATVSKGYEPYSFHGGSRRVRSKEVRNPAEIEREKKVTELRGEITRRIGDRNLSAASELYLELISVDSSQVLAKQNQLDIANQLASASKSTESAAAYEKFLEKYGNYEYIEQVELMLGLLYRRYLNEPDLAKKYLGRAVKKLRDAGQLEMCEQELRELGN